MKRSNSKENWTKSVCQLIFKQRRRVETVFSQLTGQLNAQRIPVIIGKLKFLEYQFLDFSKFAGFIENTV